MYKGIDYWDRSITADFFYKRIEGRDEFLTYAQAPESLYHAFLNSSKRFPTAIAVVDHDGIAYSYQSLYNLVEDFAQWMTNELKIEKRNFVAFMFYNSIEFCAIFLALNKIGAVAVPLPTKFKKEEIHSLLKELKLYAIICDNNFRDFFTTQGVDFKKLPSSEIKDIELSSFITSANKLEFNNNFNKISDLSLLLFTSGTTGKCKKVPITNYNIMHAIISYQRILNISGKDSSILPTPIYLVTGLVAVLGLMIYVGGSLYLHRFFNAKNVLETIIKNNITFLHASPTVFNLLLQEKENFNDLPSLRMMICGAGNMPPSRILALHKWLPHAEFRTVYGLTETTSPATIFPKSAAISPYIGSSGIPIPGLEIKIIDAQGREVNQGESGEILLRGTNVIRYYLGLEQEKDKENWLNTGDIGYLNQEGYLYILDRKKDMINRGGEKICSFDIENALLQIAGIEDAVVVGLPDDLYGEIPVALIKQKCGSNLSQNEIKAHLKTQMASYKIPEKIVFTDVIPVNNNFKPDKKKIREMLISLIEK